MSSTSKLPVSLRIAGLLHFIWAALFGLVVAAQLIIVVVDRNAGGLPLAAWNLLVVGLYVRMGVGCWRAEPWVYKWSTGSNGLNALIGFSAIDGIGFMSLLVALEVAMFALVKQNHDVLVPAIPATGSKAPARDAEPEGLRGVSGMISMVGVFVALYVVYTTFVP